MTEEQSAPGTTGPSAESDVYLVACRNSPTFCKLYEIDSWQRLGGGRSGCVARVESRARRAPVVVKILEHCGESTLARIADELKIVDTITSDHVVRVFGAHEADGLVWIEMEYVAGPTLRQVEDERDTGVWFSPREAAELALELCRGLADIHGAGAIHRDIKPENVVLPAAGRVRAKIVDFGIARFMDQERLTLSGEFKGTPEYSPPEYFRSRRAGEAPPRFGPEVDIYSLGVLLYRLFTGARPFDVTGTHEVARAHLHAAPTPPQHARPGLPRELCDLLLSMLSKKPNQRPTLGRVGEVVSGLCAQPEAAARKAERRWPAAAAGLLGGAAIFVAVGLGHREPVGAGSTKPLESSPPVPSTSPASEPAAWSATVTDDALFLTNRTHSPAGPLSIGVVDAEGGRHTLARVDASVEPDGTLSIPLGFFVPAVTTGGTVRQVDVTVENTSSSVTAKLHAGP